MLQIVYERLPLTVRMLRLGVELQHPTRERRRNPVDLQHLCFDRNVSEGRMLRIDLGKLASIRARNILRQMPNSPRLLPEDPLGFIRGCVEERRIFWTYHVNIRLAARFIPREAILGSTTSFEIIESYPEDKYLPSYLVRAEQAGMVFHVLFAADVEHGSVRIVTAYWPDPGEWDDNLRRRRARP